MAEEKLLKATCSVERVQYYKDSWGIVKLSVDKVKEGEPKGDKYGIITAKGPMPQPVEGNMYELVAEYVEDPKWGGQYNIHIFYTAVEFGADDIAAQKKFLSAIFTPRQVQLMYDALENPFEALKSENAAELVKVHGCGMKIAVSWINKFKSNLYLGQIYTELEQYNLTHNMIDRLMTRYGSPELVIEKVKNNPYVLCTEVDGVGWVTADKMALAGGIEPTSSIRIGAYIKHYLKKCGEEGCSWIRPDHLLGAILDELGEEVPDENITQAINDLQNELWWNADKSKIGLSRYRWFEEKVAAELIRIKNAESKINCGNWQDIVQHLEHRQGWEYTEEQKQGIETALRNNVTVITGGAGTGKTSLVNAILEVLRDYSYAQCALSGRAASRMSEVTGQEGYTIHRLLGYPKGKKQGFAYHEDEKLPYEIYIVDEVSMISADLFYYLLRAIPDGAKLICLGDEGQLESIGSGNVAHDMIASPEIATVFLTKIHRQAQMSAIVTESVKVRHGIQLVSQDWTGEEVRGQLQDLRLECYSDKSNTVYKITKAFSIAMDTQDFDIMETQVLVPIKSRGQACTYELNNLLQEMYNPARKDRLEVTQYMNGKPYILREGDKVMNTTNNYDIEPAIFNGNLGIIKYIGQNDADEEIMAIEFIGLGLVEVPKKYWKSIELGYAITVHKFQGSQADNVIFAIDFESYSLLTKELVYTGITRAKKMCHIIAQTGALRMAVCTTSVSKKQTHLQDCLYDAAHPKLIF